MRCEDCGKDIPPKDQIIVTINGDAKVIYPFCKECSAKLKKKLDDYPKQ